MLVWWFTTCTHKIARDYAMRQDHFGKVWCAPWCNVIRTVISHTLWIAQRFDDYSITTALQHQLKWVDEDWNLMSTFKAQTSSLCGQHHNRKGRVKETNTTNVAMADHHLSSKSNLHGLDIGNKPNIGSGFNCWWTSSIAKGIPSYLLTTMLVVQQRFALITHACVVSALFVILELDTQKSSVAATMNRCLETYSGIYCSPRLLKVARLKSFCQTNDGTCRNFLVTPAHVPIQGMAGCRYFLKEFSATVSSMNGFQNGNCSTLYLRFDF